MRGTEDVDISLTVETCRASFDLRHEDARARTHRALQRAREHGDAATARALVGLLQQNRHRHLEGDEGLTPELLVYRRWGNHHDTLGMCSYPEQQAAKEIAAVVEALTSPLSTRTAFWEMGRVDCAGGGSMPERLARLYADKFLPWARWMSDPASAFATCRACGRQHVRRIDACAHCGSARLRRDQPHLALVLSVAVFGAGLVQCAEFYRMRRQRALRLLKAGLQRYSDFV